MAQDEKNPQEEELTDIEIAELANQKIKEKDKEIEKLKKDLAKQKLLTVVDEEEEEPMSREECLKRLSASNTTNYEYAEAVVGLVDLELADGKPNPLGRNGQQVYDFFKECLEDCNGEPSRFTSVYQSKIGNDEPSIAMAYRNRK